MYNINSKVDKPDIKYGYNRIIQIMQEGVSLGDLNKLYNKFYPLQQELGDIIKNNYGIINPNSSVQIIRYLQGLKNLDVYELCFVDGKWTSNKGALESLASLGYDFAIDLLGYRKAKQYAESIKSLIKAVNPRTGRIHPKVSLGKTNRIQYANPALLNIPKPLLWSVIAPRNSNNILFSADIKNQEPSILINLLNIKELKGALSDSRGLYETMFSKPFEQRTKIFVYVTKNEQRRLVSAEEMRESKEIPPSYYTPIKPTVNTVYVNNEKIRLIEVCNTITNLGVQPILPETIAVGTISGAIYRVPVKWDTIKDKDLHKLGIIEVSGKLEGIDVRCEGIERKEFKGAWNAMTYGASLMKVKSLCKHINCELVYKYFSKISEFKEYKSTCAKLAKRGLQNINTLFGTQLYANEYEPNRLQRVLMDLPIQGTGSDILYLLIKHFDEEVYKRGLVGKISIYFTRHDELILEADNNWVHTIGIHNVVNIIRDILEHKIDDWEPFKLEVKPIDSFASSLLKLTDSDDDDDDDDYLI